MSRINSRQKGARGERLWRDVLRAAGYMAHRGQQFAGGTDSPDVVCKELDGLHFEVKNVQALNMRKAMEQATRDAGPGKFPLVAHKMNGMPWLVTMPADALFSFLRGDLSPGAAQEVKCNGDLCSHEGKLHCMSADPSGYFLCNREKGHEGAHVACGSVHNYATWTTGRTSTKEAPRG